jgi:tetratricopeptide (TPR) repeat protein
MRLRLLIATMLLVPVTSSQAAEEPWREMQAPHYHVLSQLNDRDTAFWVRQYDQFIASTAAMLSINLKALPPLTVILFLHDRDFEPYKMARPNGTNASVAGEFIRQPTWSVIGLASNAEDEGTRQTIFHEGTHWLMSVDTTRQPPWFSEGIADLFSTFERHGGTVNWAKPIDWHIFQLKLYGTIPLQEFLLEDSAVFDKDSRTSRYYAQSWAFVHFLLLSKDASRRDLLTTYLSNFRSNTAAASIEATFGSSLGDVQHEFISYVQQPRFAYVTKPVVAIAEPPPLTVARAADVQAALAFLALGSDKPDLAHQHAARAMELDQSLPGPHEVLAYLSQDKKELDQAATHAEAALGNGSKDADMFLMLGDSYRFGANGGKAGADLQSVRMYENAINLNPRRQAAYEKLVEMLVVAEAPTVEDAKFLDLGVRAYPDEDWISVGVAAVAYKLGRRDQAVAGIDKSLRSNGTLDDAQRKFATGLRHRWYLEEANTQVQAAVARRDFAAALKSTEACRNQVAGDATAEAQLQAMQVHVEALQVVDNANQARQAGNKVQAVAMLDKLLQRPDLPPDLRRYVEQARK